MTDRSTLQTALLQTLENLQRCGLRMIPATGQLSEDVAEKIAQLLSSSEPSQISGSSVTSEMPSRPAQSPRNDASQVAIQSSRELGKAPTNDHQATLAAGQNSAHTQVKQRASIAEIELGQWQTSELDDAARQNLFQMLNQEIKACRKCSEICSYRHQTVFGIGPIRPTVCFMGEAPGADEDRQGEPFVGRAGQLLNRIIEAMQLKREQIYILNSLKCRPPGNRTPLPDEITNCHPFVETQIETLRPKYIVCLGAVAVRSLLKQDTPVGQLRGKFFAYRGARVLVTYHPSYLLRNESAKRLVWEDMQLLMRELGIAPKPR